MSDADQHDTDGNRRQANRRKSQMPIAGDDRRQSERRSKDQLRRDYDDAVTRAKAALLTYGMDSPEFAEAARASEDLNLRIKQIDRASDPDKGS